MEAQDKEYIELICKEHWKELYRFIYYKVQNREEAEDFTQETFAKAIAYSRKNNIKIKNYNSYLKTIAINLLRDQWRSNARKGQSFALDEVDDNQLATEDFTSNLAEREELKLALSQLTNEQQIVINLRIIKGCSLAETAKQMKKREGTVRVLQYRAIKALSRILNL
ncbi:MAG: putative sigma factor [Herbinix sp.]|jgi:RNA polymerase sigma-70 factor (ECF subfamily)|nr:putative sigma factor [Herbinix sp.]